MRLLCTVPGLPGQGCSSLSRSMSHQFPGTFWPHNHLGIHLITKISLLCLRITAPHPFLQRWAASPTRRTTPAPGSALPSYGPSGPVGKQVQTDYLWDTRLLKEQGKARGNYFISWSGEKNVVTRLESSSAQWHMWAHGMSVDLGFSKTWESLTFSGVLVSTLTYTEMGHLSPGAWLLPRGATSKQRLTSELPTESFWSPAEGRAFTYTCRSINPSQISSQR